MRAHRLRSVAVLVLASFVVALSGVSPALAANGSVRGRVTAEGGPLPPGSQVRATPLAGGAPLAAPIAADGTYAIAQIPEGAYRFEVVGPGGEVLGTTRTLVTAAPLQLPLRARVPTVSPITPSEPEEPEEVKVPDEEAPPGVTPVTGPSRRGPSMGKRKWAILGTIVGGLGLGFAVGDDDPDGSPSQP